MRELHKRRKKEFPHNVVNLPLPKGAEDSRMQVLQLKIPITKRQAQPPAQSRKRSLIFWKLKSSAVEWQNVVCIIIVGIPLCVAITDSMWPCTDTYCRLLPCSIHKTEAVNQMNSLSDVTLQSLVHYLPQTPPSAAQSQRTLKRDSSLQLTPEHFMVHHLECISKRALPLF